MLVFSGDMSVKCIDYMLEKESKLSGICALIASIIVGIPLLFATIFYNALFSLFYSVLILFVLLAFKRASKKNYGNIIPKTIVIEKDGTMTAEGEKFFWTAFADNVKEVLDCGDWYHIIFLYPYRNPRFVCQKSLIMQGTLDDFEKFFNGKIIRKEK